MADESSVQHPWELPDGNNQDMPGSTADVSQNSAAQPATTVSVKKNKKKKKMKAYDTEFESFLESLATPEPEVIPEPEAIPSEEPIPAEEDAPLCEIPPPALEEPEPWVYTPQSVIEKPHTPVDHGVGQPSRFRQGIDTPTPIYLNFNAQHRLMVFLQQKLEEMCFAFCQRRMPQTLLDNGWDCPESAELQNWVMALKKELPSAVRLKERKALTSSMSRIRDCAVSRTRINNVELEELLSDALKLAILLEQDQYVKAIQRVQQDISDTYRYLDEERKQLEKSCNFKLGEITAARAKLDDLERATKAAFDKSLLNRHNKARSMVLQSVQNAEALDHKLDPEDRSVTMSSLDLVNDLENSLTIDEDGGRLL
ncbi:uncharacterized protein FIESC28_01618 [Fusarium coffeatum]|uniref:Uncharacterized protein n=1 Tax=Fusarium coffeatum TaxID=231269 RepID=A0A366SAK8_9HYPO|nr:uncharacterized protein FIESC28_01618 [Fusarium coffeatum]RBR25655.1 hypothetical protein FIESC28_01618 [Fusarium coffeatum]